MNIERARKNTYRVKFTGRLKGSSDPIRARTVLIPALNGIAARINVKLLYEVVR